MGSHEGHWDIQKSRSKGTMNLRNERPNVHTVIRDGEICNAGEGGVTEGSTAGPKCVAESIRGRC